MSIDTGDRWVECQLKERERVGNYMYDHQNDYVKRSRYEKVQKRLVKAKELIELLLSDNRTMEAQFESEEQVKMWFEHIHQAEQFLNSMVEK